MRERSERGIAQQVHARVRGLVENALSRARDPMPDLQELVMQLDEARQVAMTAYPPQVNAAVNAIMSTAKLLGFVIDRQQVAAVVGGPQDFNVHGPFEDRERAVIERLRERVGSRNADRFMAFIEDMRRDDDDVIEAED
jgi:hypothetical protein